MNLPLSPINKPKIGSCPHGLPAGACPICSGMGGGGGGSRKTNKASGEMSWDECNAVWQQMLRAKNLAQQKKDWTVQAQLQNSVNFSNKLDNMAQKIASLTEKLMDFVQQSKNNPKAQILPKIVSKSVEMLANLAIPVLNLAKNVTILAQKTINFIQTKFADITDKLSAIFGELKNSMDKKISDKLKNVKKKFKSLFGLFETEETKSENEMENRK